MSNKDLTIKTSYIQEVATTSSEELGIQPSQDEEVSASDLTQEIETMKYGTGKPERVVIRAKVIHDDES